MSDMSDMSDEKLQNDPGSVPDQDAMPRPRHIPRCLGRVVGDVNGPTFIAVGGIHGNEPAGVHAAEAVLERLEAAGTSLRGTFVAFAGNVAGLNSQQRYLDRDLNRLWNDDDVSAALAGDDRIAEYREVRELWQAIAGEIERARGPVYLVDCHTSSAAGVPFVLFGDTPAQHAFVDCFPIPVIEGLVEQVSGVLATYWTRVRDVVTCTIEGGQHEASAAVDALTGGLWLGLPTQGCSRRRRPPTPPMTSSTPSATACPDVCVWWVATRSPPPTNSS